MKCLLGQEIDDDIYVNVRRVSSNIQLYGKKWYDKLS